jgi:hypothetical protein
MITLEQYIKEHGYKVSDFTEEELKEIQEEVDDVNAGVCFLDGFFAFRIKYLK